jgi:hypothetical protein
MVWNLWHFLAKRQERIGRERKTAQTWTIADRKETARKNSRETVEK